MNEINLSRRTSNRSMWATVGWFLLICVLGILGASVQATLFIAIGLAAILWYIVHIINDFDTRLDNMEALCHQHSSL